MEYNSNFSFLEGKRGFNDIYDICIQFEKSIINQCFNSALMTGRVASERLLVKLGLKDSYIRKNLLIKDGSTYKIKKDITVDKIIYACLKSKEELLDNDLKEAHFSIKNIGNTNAHGINISKYGIEECKNMHKLLFDVAVNCFNHYNYDDIDEYDYNLDKVDINKRFTSDEVFSYLNNIHENEINTADFIEYIKAKKIFFTQSYFGCVRFDTDV